MIAKSKLKKKRRYALHAKVKKFATINVRTRTITITESLVANLEAAQSAVLNELGDEFGYNLQYTI